ncbi:MAG: LysR family transcriptional regulator [Parvibaculaceae bacterium]
MDFRQIQYFVALYEERSITKAARRLHVVQPAVSMQIRRLEVDNGAVLFERSAQGVIPNAAAARLYPLCVDILERLETVKEELRNISGRLIGNLSVGVPPSVALGILPAVLTEFCAQNPDVQLTVHEGYSAHLVEWLVEGKLDVAVLSEFEEERRLRYQRLVTEELLLVTNVASEIPGPRVKCADIQDLKLVLPSPQNLTRILIDNELERAGLRLTATMEVDSLAVVFGLIRDAGWNSILPAAAVKSAVERGDLKSFHLTEPEIHRNLIAAFPGQKSLSAPAQLFVGYVEAALKSLQ